MVLSLKIFKVSIEELRGLYNQEFLSLDLFYFSKSLKIL